jgi:glutamate-1-semialdehyde 2,1-aminomutase
MSPLDQHAAPRNSDLDEAVAEARERYAEIRPRSAELHARAREVMPAGNTRSNLFYAPFPTAMAGGKGCHVTDVDGHSYADFCGEYTAGLFGHSEPRIQAAIQAAIARGTGLAAVGENESRFAGLVCARFPSIERVRFTNSGTEANLMALTLARFHTGRAGVLVFNGGYHGSVLTFVSGPNPMNAPLDVTLVDYNDLDAAVATLRAERARIGAVILEPMMGSGGCIPADPAFLQGLRDITRELGMLLIFDEVMTSRHSAGGLQRRLGITPDLTTLGKYLAGGMSIGAFGGAAAIMQAFDGALTHSGTFNNNVLSMAGGVAALGEIFDDAAAEALHARGEALRAALNAVCAAHRVTLQFTGIGSMMQPHFRLGPILRPYASSKEEEALRELFFLDMLASGIYLARRGMVAMSLPVGEAETTRFIAAVTAFCAARAPLMRS